MAATMDLSGIHGSNGGFDFSDGAQFEVEVKKGTKIISGIVIVGAGPTTFAKGNHQVEVAIDTTGNAAITSSTSDDVTTWDFIKAVQKDAEASQIIDAYTKAESDAKFVLQTTQITKDSTQDTAIAKNKHDITTKQNISDSSLPTTNKTISGSIAEIHSVLSTTTQAVNDLNELKVGDGTRTLQDLTDTENDRLYTKKDIDNAIAAAIKTPMTVTKVNELIDAKLSEALTVTFDDDTTKDFKIGD